MNKATQIVVVVTLLWGLFFVAHVVSDLCLAMAFRAERQATSDSAKPAPILSPAWELMALAKLDDERFAERCRVLGPRAPQLVLDAITRDQGCGTGDQTNATPRQEYSARAWALECVRTLGERRVLPHCWRSQLGAIAKRCDEISRDPELDGATALRAIHAIEALEASPRTRAWLSGL